MANYVTAADIVRQGLVGPQLTNPRTYPVRSRSHPDRRHITTLSDDGNYCDCESGRFRRGDDLPCIHVLGCQMYEHMNQQMADLDVVDDGDGDPC